MTGSVGTEDLEYVKTGAKVSVQGLSGDKTEDAQIQSVQEDAANPGSYLVTVPVSGENFAVGESVEFTVTEEKGPYTSCVPLSAIYGQEGQQYVFVLDTKSSVLGEVQVARKVDVAVEEKNETQAALRTGALSADQKVITASDRELEDGSRVRLQES